MLHAVEKIHVILETWQNSKSGLFIDNNFDIKRTAGFEEEYILLQFTYFTTIALEEWLKKTRFNF